MAVLVAVTAVVFVLSPGSSVPPIAPSVFSVVVSAQYVGDAARQAVEQLEALDFSGESVVPLVYFCYYL